MESTAKEELTIMIKDFFEKSFLSQLEKSYDNRISLVKSIMYDFYDMMSEIEKMNNNDDNSSKLNYKKITATKLTKNKSTSELRQRSTSVDRFNRKKEITKNKNFYLPKVEIDIDKAEKERDASRRRSEVNEYSKKVYMNFISRSKNISRATSTASTPRNYRLEPKKRNFSVSHLISDDIDDELNLRSNRVAQSSQNHSLIFNREKRRSFKKKNNIVKIIRNETILHRLYQFFNIKKNPIKNINIITRMVYIEECIKRIKEKINEIKDTQLSSIMQKEVLSHVEAKLTVILTELRTSQSNNN